MSNPTSPAVKHHVDGVALSLRFDFEAIARAEEITNRPLLTGLSHRDIATPTISLVRAMLFACMLPDQPATLYDDAKALVRKANIVDVWSKVLVAWEAGLAEPSLDESSDPSQGQS